MFLGREIELKMLNDCYDSDSFEFGVIHGRKKLERRMLN